MNNQISENQISSLQEKTKSILKTKRIVPPVSMNELRKLSRLITSETNDKTIEDLALVVLSNCIWEDVFSGIPFSQRILVIPQCLRNEELCCAEFDEYGLLCASCGNCHIGTLLDEAETLGYTTFVAEGATLVTHFVKNSKISGIIGVGCLSALEEIFPYLSRYSIPGIGIPLLTDGCKNTILPLNLAKKYINLAKKPFEDSHADLIEIQNYCKNLFTSASLKKYFKSSEYRSSQIALDFLKNGGNRWRPVIICAIYQALTRQEANTDISTLAISIECFHKASLIHDDIEDSENKRYGKKSFHLEYGIPLAVNTGDLLIGYGYNLVAGIETDKIAKDKIVDMLSGANLNMCTGQGEELLLRTNPAEINVQTIIDIFSKKTVPAFRIAFLIPAVLSGCSPKILDLLDAFSFALGMAYQVRDDIVDFRIKDGPAGSLNYMAAVFIENTENLSIIMDKSLSEINKYIIENPEIFSDLKNKANQAFSHYKNQAFDIISELREYYLKSILNSLIHKLLD